MLFLHVMAMWNMLQDFYSRVDSSIRNLGKGPFRRTAFSGRLHCMYRLGTGVQIYVPLA